MKNIGSHMLKGNLTSRLPYGALGLRVIIAVVCVGAAALLTWPLRLVGAEGSRFLFVYVLPIGAAGYLGGRFAGVLAASLAWTIMWFPVLPPSFPFTLERGTLATAVTFFLTGIAAAFTANHVRQLELARAAGETAEREDKERLALALEAGRLGSWEWDVVTGRVTWSPTLEEIHGLRPGSFEGTFEAYQRDIHPDDRDRVLAVISAAVAGPRDHEIEYRIILPDGQVRWLSARGKVTRDRHGRPLRMSGVCSDITESKMLEEFRAELLVREKAARRESEIARERLGLLLEAGALMASSLDYATTLRNVARAAVPNFADWCVFDIIEPDGSVERAAILHRDPAKLEIANEIARLYPPDPEILRSLQTGSPKLYPELTDDLLKQSATDDNHLRLLRALDLRSAMLIPLKARGRTIGLLYLATAESERRYDEEDLALAEALGRRVALSVENARLYAREHLIAQTLQHAFLPKELPRLPGILLDAAYVPGAAESELGGDWYDAFQLSDGRVVLSMGDVTGHGLQAAVSMGQIRQAIRAAAYEGDPPAAILSRANRLLTRSGGDAMATALVGVLDPATMVFSHATAGHPTPLLTAADGTVKSLPSGGLPLGMRAVATVPSVAGISLPLGSLLVLYTDGLIEHNRDPIQGEAELIQAIRAEIRAASLTPAKAILDRMLAGKDPHDDVALLILLVDPVPLKTLDLTLPAIPSTLPLVRQSLQQLANGVGLEPARLAALQVAVGEAMNNVIEHAYGVTPGTVRVRAAEAGGRLVVEIVDAGEWRRERQDGGGRGLRIMRALVDEVTVERTEAGTTARLSIGLGVPVADPTP